MKKPATVRPDKAMTEALKNVPGARFAERRAHDPGRGDDQRIDYGATNLSQAFSLGKRDSQ
ncbi:MAG TPA: hypothetical protein VM163_13280 [bacterium]|nr:hypothetical protein [bacterium]